MNIRGHQRSSEVIGGQVIRGHQAAISMQSGAFTCTGGAVSMFSSSHSGMVHDIRVAREPSHLYLMKELIRSTQAHSGAIRVTIRFEPGRSVQRRANHRRRPGREREADEGAVPRW